MDEPTTHDDGHDEVAAQLRRYADAANAAVPSTPTLGAPSGRRRAARPWLAAASAVVLIGGGLAAYALVDGDGDSVRTVDEPPVEPYPDLDDACPAPRADGPRIDDLTVLLPYVAASSSDTTTDDQGRVDSMRIVVEQQGDELRVAEVDRDEVAEMFPGGGSATFEICDPFAAAARRTAVPGSWAIGQDRRLHAELGLTDGNGVAWLVTVSTPLDDRDPASEQTDSARAEVRRLIAGMSWPAPVEVPRRNDVCANEPVAAVGSHQLLALPDGYTPGEPEEVDTGAVDMGGEQWTRLPLQGPDGAQISVVSIGTSQFAEALANNAVGIEPGSLTIQRCRTTSTNGDGAPSGTDELTEIRRGRDRTVIGAQESEYGGWMVIGTGGATEEDIVATAEALRS